MKVKVKIKSEQIFEDRRDSEEHVCEGEIEYLEKGTILKFTEKFEEQELKFKMTILENKIIIDRQNQTITLDHNMDDNCVLETPYGSMNMTVHTQEMQIEKDNELIQNIILKYKITLENGMKYDNIIKLFIS